MSGTVSTTRSSLRSAEDEYTRASALVSAASEFAEQRRRGTGANPEPLVDAMGRFLNPGPGAGTSGVVEPADRASELQFLTDTHLEQDGERTDFFSAASTYAGQSSETVDGEDLAGFVTDLETFVTGSGTRDADAVVATLSTLASGGSAALAAQIAEVTRLLARTARDWRDELVADLNNDFPEDEWDADAISSGRTGEVQSYLDGRGDPVENLENEAIALLPIRLETRFVDSDRGDVEEPELWVRVYPDDVHTDSHEEQLTDREVRFGRTYWAYCWLGTHSSLESVDRAYLEAYLPDDADRLVELLAAVDAASFPDDPTERKDAIKERAWLQLLEGLGRERAAYVVHACRPDGWEVLADDEALLAPAIHPDVTVGEEAVDVDELEAAAESDTGAEELDTDNTPSQPSADRPTDSSSDDVNGPAVVSGVDTRSEYGRSNIRTLKLPEPPRRPASWTRPPVARLLPDQWIAYGVWTHNELDFTEVFTTYSNAVREPLPVGPDPESMAVAEQYGDDPAAEDPSEVGDVSWITDFGEAERAGMAFRITEDDVFSGAPSGVIDQDDLKQTLHDITDGQFEQLVVTGVKSSMDPEGTSRRLRDLLDAHHYTEGLELVRQGTPTNNADVTAGYRSKDDPRESMAIECDTALLEHGDYSDGDQLARALGVDPAAVGGAEHVFAHVENADATDQLDAWYANAALWPATLGYYYQNMLYPMSSGDRASLLFDSQGPEEPWIDEGQGYEAWHAERAGTFKAIRRHFIEFVRSQGPLPAFRTGTQPYGVLPVTPMADDRDDLFAADTDSDGRDSGRTRVGHGHGWTGSDTGQVGGGSLQDRGDDWSFKAWSSEGGDGAGTDTEDASIDAATAWETSSPETFRRTVSPVEARGEVPDEAIAEAYTPEEAATTFTTAELARHYEPAEAARVLSPDQLRANYSEEALADADVDPDALDDGGGG